MTVLLVLITVVTTRAQQSSPNAAEQEIINLEKAFAAAIKNRDSVQTKQMQRDSYFLAVGVKGMPLQVIPQRRWLDNLKVYVVESYSMDDIKVSVYENTAVAMMMFSQKAKVHGQDRRAQFVITDIWVKEWSQWKIAERHSSRPEVRDASPK